MGEMSIQEARRDPLGAWAAAGSDGVSVVARQGPMSNLFGKGGQCPLSKQEETEGKGSRHQGEMSMQGRTDLISG